MNDEYGFGVEEGEVRDVPSLQAPGFIKASAQGHFNDASEALKGDLILNVRSPSADYGGYRISFGSHFNVFNDFKDFIAFNENIMFTGGDCPSLQRCPPRDGARCGRPNPLSHN